MVQRTAGLIVLASFNIVSEKGSEMHTLVFITGHGNQCR